MTNSVSNEKTIVALEAAERPYRICLPHAATDYIQGKIAKERVPYELEMLNDMRIRVQAGDFVIDVGANIGNHTLFLAACGCDVLAFEPNPQLTAALHTSIELNDWSGRVSLRAVGLGKEIGSARFAREDAANMGGMSLQTGTGELKIVTLDSLKLQRKPALIKIDVEGMEMDVLLGGENLIKMSRPLIYVECLDQIEFRSVFNWLSERGYTYWDTFNASPTHLFFPIEKTTADQRVSRLQYKEVLESYRTTGQLNQLRKQLDDANKKYRDATQQVASLKERILQEEANRLTVVSKLEQSSRAAAHEAEKQLISVQAQLDGVHARLEDANKKYRGATEQVAELKQRLAQEEAARAGLQQRVAQEEAARAGLQQRVAQEEAARAGLQQRVAQEEAASAALQQRVAQEEAARAASDGKLQQTQAQLADANLKYRKVTGEEIPKLKSKLEESYATKRAQQHLIEQLNLDVKGSMKAHAEAIARLQKLHQQKIAADQQVIKTRASLSFQLGYLLIHSFKSVRGVTGLPTALWAWRKEVLKRRAKKNQRQDAVEAALAASTVPAAIEAPAWQAPVVTQSEKRVAASVPVRQIPALPPVDDLRQLKMASIMDEFTFNSYRHECVVEQLTPDNWKSELEAFRPELLFIESAWRGKDELWGSKVGHSSQELQGIVSWCRAKKVPTVFWNKEDPVHFESFLTTARLFDYVFTTDIDCIHRYKAALGHERVYLLPFACQPVIHNPIETYDRKDAFCFAGAYYVRYPERTRDLGNFVAELPAFRPLEIYDRNFGKNDPNYQFPPEYQPYIVGTLPFDQIDKAYKGYRYAINLNSIKQSQTMFARRVFELLASNTITVSNFSRGLRLLFGDLVITTDSGTEMLRHLNKVASSDMQGRKLRLAALRKVMEEHTYGDRLAYVVSRLSGQPPQSNLPNIAVVAHVASQSELDSILHQYQQQRHAHRSLLIMQEGDFAPQLPMTNQRIRLLRSAEMGDQTMRAVVGDVDLVAAMTPDDYYGPNYLLDIALATRYTDADILGKGARFTVVNGVPALQDADAAYRPTNSLPARAAAVRLGNVADVKLAEWLAGLNTLQLTADNPLAIDEFNYCENGADRAIRDMVAASVGDLPGLDTGIKIDELLTRAERIAPEATGHDEAPVLTGRQFAAEFRKVPSAAIKLGIEDDHWRVESTLPDGKHEYLYATTEHNLKELGAEKQFRFFLDTTPGLNIQLTIFFLDAQKQKISHVIKHANRNQEADIPLGTASIRFGLRFYSSGSAEIKGLVLGHRSIQPAELVGQAEYLLLTNHYPSNADLYRNAFVHSRVRAYLERGVRCDVFRLRPSEAVSYHEFEGVDVTTGSQEALHKMLLSGQYKSVLVHFLDASMWEVLKHYVDRIKIVVWIHGSEIQPWHRRDFNYQTEDERTVARMKSDARMAFWRELLRDMPANMKLVFVSRYFADEVMEDLGFRISEDRYTIIHNPINTDTFGYVEKPVEQRKKVLSIRPYASAKYANDLSVKAILLLSEKPWFQDMEFRMIGDGVLFEETLAPLRELRNVYMEQRFLKQDEIAALHKEYGIFLCPTRMDAQGVSRDEAMSSGLVPVTNAVTAIPEFVDADCGVLAPNEDAEAMAKGIAALYESPEKFCAMSSAAAARVRSQSSSERIVARELDLFSSRITGVH